MAGGDRAQFFRVPLFEAQQGGIYDEWHFEITRDG